MDVLLDPGHRASLEKLEKLFEAALLASVARICNRAGVARFSVALDWHSHAPAWGVRAQSVGAQVAIVGAVAEPLGPAHWWRKRVVLTISDEASNDSANFSLFLPWLLDSTAWNGVANDAELRLDIAERLGGSEGLYFGGVRVPSIIAALRPGLHRVEGLKVSRPFNPDNVDLTEYLDREQLGKAYKRKDMAVRADEYYDSERLRELFDSEPPREAILVPDLGDVVRVQIRSRRVKRPGKKTRFEKTADLIAHVVDGRDASRVLLDSTRDAVSGGLALSAGDAFDGVADALERWLRRDDVAVVRPTDEGACELRYWGDALAYALHRGIRRAERLLMQKIDAGGFASRSDDDKRNSFGPRNMRDALDVALGKAVRDLLAGDGAHAGLARVPDNTSTLSRIETHRQVSFYGPRALNELRSRLDLRDLGEDWQRKLCPLQTPESTKVGLVRYLAAGDLAAGEWSDLSLSACLVPFIDCDDAAKSSTGSKNLKQAVAIVGAAPPRVRTGWEARLANLAGVSRSPVRGEFVEASEFTTTVRDTRGDRLITFGPGKSMAAGPDRSWAQGGNSRRLARDDLIALAPDVRLDSDGLPVLSLGVDALVALTPWYGLNHEDGMVVSESFAAKLASRERVVIREPYDEDVDGEILNTAIFGTVKPGTSLVKIEPQRTVNLSVEEGRAKHLKQLKARKVNSTVEGTFVGVRCIRGMVEIAIDVDRPLQVGDKLTNRHGGKGVVCAILPDDEMPRIGSADGDVVDAILNPLGVLRRLNIGQLWEMHFSLDARLRGIESVTVGRRPEGIEALADRLSSKGAADGRMELFAGPTAVVGPGTRIDHGDGVVVGEQYLLKLDHLAVNKVRARGADSPRSPRTFQPSRQVNWSLGRRGAAAQRLGEMEIWALAALGLRELLDDVVNVRGRVGSAPSPQGVKPTLAVVAAHLAVASLEVRAIVDGSATAELHSVWPDEVDDFEVLNSVVDAKPVDADFLEDIARSKWIRAERAHPLYDGRHGTRDQRERIRWAIELPFPVKHPWDTEAGDALVELQPITSVPILPPAMRAFGQDGLDARYAELAGAVLEVEDELRTLPSGADPTAAGRGARVSVAVDAILGRSRTVARLVREGRPRWGEALGNEGPPPESENQPRADERDVQDAAARTTRDRSTRAVAPDSTIARRLQDKKGLLRRSLLGHAAQRSGRAVIVGDPARDPQTVGVPDPVYRAIIDPADAGEFRDVVVLNRQPTLRPNAMVALRAESVPGDALEISPVILDCLAGDFDGDTAAVHWPQSEAARREAWEWLRPAQQLRNYGSKTGLLAKLDLDAALGLLLASGTPSARKSLPGKFGRPELKVSKALDSAGIASFVTQAASILDKDQFAALLADALRLGTTWATGFSLGALELRGVTGLDEINEATKPSSAATLRLRQLLAVKAVDETALIQLLLSRGEVDTGRDSDKPLSVEGCYLVGLTPDEAYLASRGGILKLATKKLITPLAGDFTKQLVEIGYEVTVTDDEDCGAATRDPLHCRLKPPFLCRVCAGGWMEGPGAPGVLAGMVIGQRSTQLALKANRASSKSPELERIGAVFGNGGISWPDGHPQLRREDVVERRLLSKLIRKIARVERARQKALARGKTPKPKKDVTLSIRETAEQVLPPVELHELLKGVTSAGPALAAAAEPALLVFDASFGDSVDRFWAQVVVRQLWSHGLTVGATATEVMYAGKRSLSAATVRGDLTRLVRTVVVRPDAEVKVAEPRRTALFAGSWT